MGWAVGFDEAWQRDIGYGVPAVCDQPDCSTVIDRGLSYVCGNEPYGGEAGCGLYFCGTHLIVKDGNVLCARCLTDGMPFQAKPDVKQWIEHKLTDPSWATWRGKNPRDVARLQAALT